MTFRNSKYTSIEVDKDFDEIYWNLIIEFYKLLYIRNSSGSSCLMLTMVVGTMVMGMIEALMVLGRVVVMTMSSGGSDPNDGGSGNGGGGSGGGGGGNGNSHD